MILKGDNAWMVINTFHLDAMFRSLRERKIIMSVVSTPQLREVRREGTLIFRAKKDPLHEWWTVQHEKGLFSPA